MHRPDFPPADRFGVLKRESQDALAGLASDELDALNHAVDHDVLDPGVFAFCVLSDEDGVDIVVWRLVARDGSAGPHVGEEVEGSAQGEIQGDVPFAYGRLLCGSATAPQRIVSALTARGPFNATRFFSTLSMASSGIAVRPSFRIGVTSTGSHFIGTCPAVSDSPLDDLGCSHFGCREYVLHRLRDFRSNPVALNQCDRVFALTAHTVQLCPLPKLRKCRDNTVRVISPTSLPFLPLNRAIASCGSEAYDLD